jgi:hypothetical protein
VVNGHNGFTVAKPTKVPYIAHGIFPNTFSRGFMRSLHKVDKRFLSDLYSATAFLVENTHARSIMSRNSFKEVEFGKFSISKRNERLREIFENAIGR